ncbi:MAG: hypothetical protein HKO92_10135 [Flavobacteriaceae bacterium]|nr:hypothetical protein [Flavobacteriaceae bacterium]
MAPFIPIVLVVCIVAIIGFLVYYFSLKQRIIRKLKTIKTKPIGSLKTNELSKITGKALHVKEPLIAPFSKRPCIFYSIKIEQKVSNGKSTYWKKLIKEEKFQDFFVERNGDYVIVQPNQNPKNYLSYLVIDRKISSGTFNDPTPEFKKLLTSYNINIKGFLGFNKPLRYTEGIIEVGEHITVAGIAKWKTLSQPIEGYNYSKIAALESSDKEKIIITDLPFENRNRR